MNPNTIVEQVTLDIANNSHTDHMLIYCTNEEADSLYGRLIDLGCKIRRLPSSSLERAGDIASVLTSISPEEFVWLDDIGGLDETIEALLVPAMRDNTLELVVGSGKSARTMTLNLPKFTLIGVADTRTSALYDTELIKCLKSYASPFDKKRQREERVAKELSYAKVFQRMDTDLVLGRVTIPLIIIGIYGVVKLFGYQDASNYNWFLFIGSIIAALGCQLQARVEYKSFLFAITKDFSISIGQALVFGVCLWEGYQGIATIFTNFNLPSVFWSLLISYTAYRGMINMLALIDYSKTLVKRG